MGEGNLGTMFALSIPISHRDQLRNIDPEESFDLLDPDYVQGTHFVPCFSIDPKYGVESSLGSGECTPDSGRESWAFSPNSETDELQFKTIINLGVGEESVQSVNVPGDGTTDTGAPSSPLCPITSTEGDSHVQYRVVLNIGEGESVKENMERQEGSGEMAIKDYDQVSISATQSCVSGAYHFSPPSVPQSSLYIRANPPPVPYRSKKTTLSARSTLLAMTGRHPTSTVVPLSRNESQSSDYGSSSTLSYLSLDSPASSPSFRHPSSPSSRHASSPSSRHDSSSSRDSDYFGSSSEDDDFEFDKEKLVIRVRDFIPPCGNDTPEEEEEEEEEEDKEDPNDQLAPLKPIFRFPGLRKMRRFAHSTQSHPTKEYDLEQRIALEIKMREGTTKLLAACGGKGPQASQPHTLEAAKSLLTSNERMTAYMAELQRRRNSRRINVEGCEPSLARVCLSDLRMPLLWKDIEHFKNKGDNRKFAVFVLLKIGTEIYDTVMVNPVDRSMTDICFDDIIVFNGIPPNFECCLEVYSYLFENEMLMASIPRKLKKTLHSSISRTVGRKLAVTLRDELASGDTGPKFEMVASAKLTVDNIANSVSTYDLSCLSSESRPDQLPLFGHFCCRLAAQPDCFTQERLSGYAKVSESDSSEPSWCRLIGWRMEVWESKEDAESSPHHPLALSVDKATEIRQMSPSSLQLNNTQSVDRGHITLNFKNSEECKRWARVLRQHVSDHERWGRAAEEEMEILTPQPSRHSFIMPKRGRFTSLYEETPLRDGSPTSEKSSTDDLYNNIPFNSYCTPASSAPRTRAFTLSSRSSFRRWGSVRANMPFFKTKS